MLDDEQKGFDVGRGDGEMREMVTERLCLYLGALALTSFSTNPSFAPQTRLLFGNVTTKTPQFYSF